MPVLQEKTPQASTELMRKSCQSGMKGYQPCGVYWYDIVTASELEASRSNNDKHDLHCPNSRLRFVKTYILTYEQNYLDPPPTLWYLAAASRCSCVQAKRCRGRGGQRPHTLRDPIIVRQYGSYPELVPFYSTVYRRKYGDSHLGDPHK